MINNKALLIAALSATAIGSAPMIAPSYESPGGAFGGKYKRRKRLSDADLYEGAQGAPRRQKRKLLKNC